MGLPKILITDTNRWPAAARLAMALAKCGCEVSAVCPEGHPLLKTRALRQGFPYSGVRPLESLKTAIEGFNPNVIVPCDDRGVQHLHDLFDWARSRGEAGAGIANLIKRSLGAPESYPIVSSRNDLLQIAQGEGLAIPETRPIRTVEDFKDWQEGHAFPWVLKADGTFGGRGVRIAQNRKEAEQYFLEMSRPHKFLRVLKRLVVNRDPFWLLPWWNRTSPAVIAQSFVKGRPANCAVVCSEGKVLAGIAVEVVSSDGITGPASVVRVSENPVMLHCAEKIARRLGISGFFGLDFMIDEASGSTLLIELNPRCTPLCHLQLGKGHDMVEALRAQLSGEAVRETIPVTQNQLIAYFPQAWTSKSEYLDSSFQDIPKDEPELIAELLRPWPDRSLLFKLATRGRALTTSVTSQKPSYR